MTSISGRILRKKLSTCDWWPGKTSTLLIFLLPRQSIVLILLVPGWQVLEGTRHWVGPCDIRWWHFIFQWPGAKVHLRDHTEKQVQLVFLLFFGEGRSGLKDKPQQNQDGYLTLMLWNRWLVLFLFLNYIKFSGRYDCSRVDPKYINSVLNIPVLILYIIRSWFETVCTHHPNGSKTNSKRLGKWIFTQKQPWKLAWEWNISIFNRRYIDSNGWFVYPWKSNGWKYY